MSNTLLHYCQLMRLHKPIGIFLLLWPTLMALWIAGKGKPDGFTLFIFVAGVIIMRSAGCVINDLADRFVDGKVERTNKRPLVLGTVSVLEAKILFTILIITAFLLVLMLNRFSLYVSFIALLLATIYPFMKRYTHFPQLILGCAFSCSIPIAFAALQNNIPKESIVLFMGTIAWVFAYDTQYAMVDKLDDLKIGIKSTAIYFGTKDRLMIFLTMLFAILCYLFLGLMLKFKFFYYIGIVAALILIFYQQYLIKTRCPKGCFIAFMNNNYVGASLFIGTLLEYL